MGEIPMSVIRKGHAPTIRLEAELVMRAYDSQSRRARDFIKGRSMSGYATPVGDELLPPKQPRRKSDRYVSPVRSLT